MAEVARNASQAFFQNSLAEVVRKLRSQSSGVSESDAIEVFINETKKEVSSTVQSVKVAAIQKAMYFHMLGFESAYANFHVVELMSDPAFVNKRIGYTAACTMFSDDTDVIPLMTALLTRDFGSANQYEVGLALYCIASVCTPDLARDLVSHVVNLLRHPRTYVRKKAALSLYKIFLQYPEALRPTYPKLKDKLDDNAEDTDTDPAVRGAVVCVLCELARRNPANFLGLAVPFYSLLQTVHSNWTLIKVIKVFGYFAPLEPRLGKKLMEPLTNLITSTTAKSVQYECLLAVANGMSKVPSLTKLAVEKLRGYAQDRDPNLKFLGLDAISRMALAHPKLLADQRDTMVATLGDADPTIRTKALLILRDLVTQSSMVKTVNNMFDACVRTPPEEDWSNDVIQTIVETVQTEDYSLVDDFEWYLGLLFDLSVLNITVFEHGRLLDSEIVTILTRVNGARAFGVAALEELLTSPQLLSCDVSLSTQAHVLRAAAFACGEYPHWLKNKIATCKALLSEAVTLLPAEIQLACVAAVCKIAAFVHQPCVRHVQLEAEEREAAAAMPDDPVTFDALKTALTCAVSEGVDQTDAAATVDLTAQFLHSLYPDVQERTKLLTYILNTNPSVGHALFTKELLSVAAGAQGALAIPDDLDLDEPFNSDLEGILTLSGSDLASSAEDLNDDDDFAADSFDLQYRVEQQRRQDEARREAMSAFYLGGGGGTGGGGDGGEKWGDSAEAEVLRQQNDAAAASAPTRLRHQSLLKPASQKRVHAIKRDLDRPQTYNDKVAIGSRQRRSVSPEEDDATRKLRNIDVTRALRADEKLPEAIPYSTLFAKPAGDTGAKGANSGNKRSAVLASAPVTVCETSTVRVQVFVDGCKAHLSGFRLKCLVEVMNLSSGSSLHNVKLTLTSSAEFPSAQLFWEGSGKQLDDEDAGNEVSAGATTGAPMTLHIADKLKGSTTERKKATLYLAALPPSLPASGIPMQLTFTREKQDVEDAGFLPLRYVYFAKHKMHTLSPQDFTEGVLQKFAEAGEDRCPTLSAFVPCSKAQLLMAMPSVKQQLFLEPVEIFKDTASLYGVLHGRKSHLEQTHVAVMLRESVEDDKKGLAVFIKSFYPCLSEALIHDIFATVLNLKTR